MKMIRFASFSAVMLLISFLYLQLAYSEKNYQRRLITGIRTPFTVRTQADLAGISNSTNLLVLTVEGIKKVPGFDLRYVSVSLKNGTVIHALAGQDDITNGDHVVFLGLYNQEVYQLAIPVQHMYVAKKVR